MRWETTPLLEIEHLTMRFGGLIAVNNVSLSAGRGDITAIIGPNGAGKTTVFNCITGFYKPTSGRMAMSHTGNAAPADVAVTMRCSCSSGCRISRSQPRRASPARSRTSASSPA
jgi:branched-chain amino acid transport system ATP-binding protein